jgi:cell division protease FtsH
VSEVSAETQQLIDREVRQIVAAAHDDVVELLRKNRDKLDSLAKALLEHETLDQPDAYAAAGIAGSARAPEPVVTG